MIKRLKLIIAELFTPTALETDTVSNKSYRRCVVAIAHCVLAAAIISLLVFFSVNYYIAILIYMSFYSVKELADLFEGRDYFDLLEDMTASSLGAIFALNPLMPIVAILIGLVVFLLHMEKPAN